MPKKGSTVRPLRVTVACALLVALSIVCGKFLQFPVGEALRFSLENLPILFAGMMFGPLTGALVGVVADLIGCLAVGYAINPLITLGGAAVGLIGGAVYRSAGRAPLGVRVTLAVAAAHLLGSVVIKTFGLAQFYTLPFVELMLWRLLNYAIVGVAEGLLLVALLKNKTLRSLL